MHTLCFRHTYICASLIKVVLVIKVAVLNSSSNGEDVLLPHSSKASKDTGQLKSLAVENVAPGVVAQRTMRLRQWAVGHFLLRQPQLATTWSSILSAVVVVFG